MSRNRFSVVLLSVAAILLGGCLSRAKLPTPTASAHTALKLAPVSALSPSLRRLPTRVQEAYRFALANPEVLSKIPCYCGCDASGHKSNRMCYIRSESADGRVVFDDHGST